MSRENARVKGQRYLTEGRLSVYRVDPHPFTAVAYCRGDSGETYALGFDPVKDEWRCTCPAKTTCSHLHALKLVTVRPNERQAA